MLIGGLPIGERERVFPIHRKHARNIAPNMFSKLRERDRVSRPGNGD